MGIFRSAKFAVPVLACLAGAAVAQDITLTSRDGSVEIIGTLIGYDGEFYRVHTEYGELTVDGSGVLCAGPGCPDLSAYVADISLSGAQIIGQELMPSLVATFADQQGYSLDRRVDDGEVVFALSDASSGHIVARLRVDVSSSDEGLADLLAEQTDIAMSMRPMSSEEAALGRQAGLGRFFSPARNRVLALDALVPVVSPRNPIQTISPEDLARAFSGDISNWRDLGGLDAPIDLYLPADAADILGVFEDRIMASEDLEFADQGIRYVELETLAEEVSGNPFALGLALQSGLSNAKTLTLAGGCGYRSAASPEALKAGDYPLTVPIFLYLRSGRFPAVGREFLRFLRSPAAQIAILRSGFVDQAFSRTPVARQGDRLANAIRAAGEEIDLAELQRLVQVMDGRRRLSVTFRFDGGSSGLNPQSRSNIALLARALETGTIGGRELVFVGFSDGVGDADGNRRLSVQRATSVRAAVASEAATADPDRVQLKVEGFGEAMPLACDDSEWGRQFNRRVEVWVR